MIRILAAFLLLVCCLGTDTATNTRLIGGKRCSAKELPFQVYLYFNDDGKFLYDCGGLIIHKSWVLTAAQCGLREDKKSFYLKSGITSVNQQGEIHYISEVIVHPKYDTNTRDYDAALLKVTQPFVFSAVVKPIQLTRNTPAAGTPVTLGGWGKVTFPGVYPKTMQCVMLIVFPQDKCEQLHRHSSFNVTSNMLCAGDPVGGKELNCGDTGIGLTTMNRKHLVGIVSWWKGNNMKDMPPVFTDVARIEHWVMSTINSHERT